MKNNTILLWVLTKKKIKWKIRRMSLEKKRAIFGSKINIIEKGVFWGD